MNFKPNGLRPITANNKKIQSDQSYELVDSTLTVRENEEFSINCVVESSRPVAEIRFSVANQEPQESSSSNGVAGKSPLYSIITSSAATSTTLPPFASSILSSNMNIAKNLDRTFKTSLTSRLRASSDDHGKAITCKADNGLSHHKWESRKVLNVLCKLIL